MITEIQKYGWTYKANKIGNSLIFDVIPVEPIKPPETLFKLFSLSENSINALVKSYVYATHPNQLNDIFDCHEDLVVFDDDNECKTFYGDFYDELKSGTDPNIFNVLARRHFREVLYRKIGVLSMTSDPYNILMWSYYTNNRGFMVEFDLSQFPFTFHGPFPLNYQETLEPVSLKECKMPLAALIQTNVKYKGWVHENEWRILIESDDNMLSPDFKILKELGGKNRKFSYPVSAIKSIALGNKFFNPDELSISSINEKILNIRLQIDIEHKSAVLEFIKNNKITLYMCKRDQFSLAFDVCKIKKGDENTYQFILN